jgi:hypothetical protein
MTPDLIAQLRAERAALQRKLEAVDAMLGAYDEAPSAPPSAPAAAAKRSSEQAEASTPLVREKLPLNRFSPYGIAVIEGAISVIESRPGGPVPTRDIVTELEKRGLEVRGNDKVNAVSALLARSMEVVNHGRRGWTRSTIRIVRGPPTQSAFAGLDLKPAVKGALADAWAAGAQQALKEETDEDFE